MLIDSSEIMNRQYITIGMQSSFATREMNILCGWQKHLNVWRIMILWWSVLKDYQIQKLRDELTANVVRVGRLNIEAAFHRKDLEIIESEIKSLYDYAEDISLRESDLQPD